MNRLSSGEERWRSAYRNCLCRRETHSLKEENKVKDGGNIVLGGRWWGDGEWPETMLERGRQGLDHTGPWTYTKVLAIVGNASGHHERVLPNTEHLSSYPTILSLNLHGGEALPRKPFVNGIPHCSFLEPGKPTAFPTSTDPIRAENALCSF